MNKFVLLTCSALLITACGGKVARTVAPFDHLAQCLADSGTIMYGSDTCPHCKAQKAEFKGSFDLVKYVECNRNAQECQDAGITGYPTWKFPDGSQEAGRKSLSSLAEKAGCELKAPEPSAEAAE